MSLDLRARRRFRFIFGLSILGLRKSGASRHQHGDSRCPERESRAADTVQGHEFSIPDTLGVTATTELCASRNQWNSHCEPDPRLPGVLYVVATPIGHLGDVSARAADVLHEVDVIVAEDTRHTRRLLNHLGVASPKLIALHEHNEARQLSRVIHLIASGQQVALVSDAVSDAGTPLISDPGYRLVDRATTEELRVVAVPGPSAVTAALSVSGLPTDRFVFEGFLPARAEARRTRLRLLSSESRTLVFFESPKRVTDTLSDIAGIFGDDRLVSYCRETDKTV